jgi:hypothetical protein
MDESEELLNRAKAVLEVNQRGDYTVPAEGLYPHQWLWDSCFIAIGLRHYDLERAQKEILSLLRGQWSNGMMPNMIFADDDAHKRDRNIWRSWLNPAAPDNVATSGITQPPLIAEAVVKIGELMTRAERRTWYQQVLPALIKYHTWLYDERDPHGEGLVLQIHPWETGLDNTPPWIGELNEHEFSLWIRLAKTKPVQMIANLFRRDIHFAAPGERLSAFEGIAFFGVQRRLRRKSYDIDKILNHSLFAIEDLNFNSFFIRANQQLINIATTLKQKLPEDLLARMQKTEDALEMLWDPYTGQYFSRNFITHKLIKLPSIATLMPLYAGTITKERAKQLVKLLDDEHTFGAPFPVPSVPLNSDWFKSHGYWQGPTWLNTNWLIIDGLKRYGFTDEAEKLIESCLTLVAESGMNEYFSPIDGSPAGVKNFSWTAALAIDLLSTE